MSLGFRYEEDLDHLLMEGAFKEGGDVELLLV